ncbi:MAG: DUF3298 and DUF4163 domain-containing protein [Candidatus Riflebacteria bacterium]|nr:DUF3298 and DUF4163 domain-containing protein [Candidatus Riflebacteria bacterium]
MRKTIGSTVAVFVLVSLATAFAATAAPLAIKPGVTAEMKELTRTVPPPKTASASVLPAEIEIRFPELAAAGKDPAVGAINKALLDRLLKMADEESPSTIEQLAAAFVRKYEQSCREPESIGAWSLKFVATIRHSDENLLSLEILQSVFTGGAHPNSSIEYVVFSLKTGQPIELTAIVPAAKAGELAKVGEKAFRTDRGLMPGESLEEAGFQFDGNTFALNDNFLVSPAGLEFCFNPYEIAPYAMGTTQIVIPWADLKGIVDPKGPAGPFVK